MRLSRNKPKMSLILHARHSGRNVKNCVDSLLTQSLSRDDYEIIVIDDASTDDTSEVLRDFKDSLSVVRTEKRWGSSKSRNQGVQRARGEIVFFTGVDCIADNQLLEEHLATHSKYKNSVVVGCIDWQTHKRKSLFQQFVAQTGLLFSQKPSEIPNPEDVPYGHAYTGNMSMPRTIFLAVGMSDERLFPGYWSDIELSHRLHKAGFRIVLNRNAVVYHSTELNLPEFSRRMIHVGKSAVTLESINPAIVDFSKYRNQKHIPLVHMNVMLKRYYLVAILWEILGRLFQNKTTRRRLFLAYRKQLDYSFMMGYMTERERLDKGER